MGTIQKQSLFVGIDFTKLLGSKEARAKNISIKIAERNADIYAERQARRFAVVSDSQYAKVLAQHDAVMTELNAVCANQTDPLSTQYEKRMALSRRLVIVGNRLKKAEKEQAAFADKAQNLIFVISNLVVRELETLCRTQPALAYDYLTGKIPHFWFTTKTQSLNTSLNRNSFTFEETQASSAEKRTNKKYQGKASTFRSEKGLYTAVEQSGFVLEKVVENANVHLKINLSWLFGWEIEVLKDLEIIAEMAQTDAVEPAESLPLNEVRRGISSPLSQMDKSKETENSSFEGVATLVAAKATIVAKKEKESEEKVNALAVNPNFLEKKEGESCAAPDFSTEKDENIALAVATDSTNRLLKSVYTQENLKNNRVRWNSTNHVAHINKADALNAKYWMLNVMRHLKRDGEAWSDVATLVNEAVDNLAKYLKKYPKWEVYHPKVYLDPQTRVGSLRHYIENQLRQRQPHQQPDAANPLNAYLPNIQWLIEQGGSETAIRNKITQYGGEEIGQKTVSDAIAVARGRILVYNLKPQKGIAAYVMGVLYRFKTAELLAADAQKLRVQYSEKRQQETPALYWTEQRIKELFNEMTVKMTYLRSFVTDSDITKFANNYKNRQPNAEGQLKMDLEDLAKKRRDKAVM